jgi:tRNA-specific 2-thiouridylase
MDNPNKTILVAMSGGVDSSVALLILKQQGYQVAGATMKLWDFTDVGGDTHRDGRCCNLETIENARSVCESQGVPHYVLDFSEAFKKTVIENFVAEYRAGRTPNPCIVCNSEIKWEMFLKRALEIGCDAIATGHYARTGSDEISGRYFLKRGIDDTRDQSYALWGIAQQALSRTFLPLGEITKKETRRLAAEAGIKTAHVAESMEICFVADDDYERFLREWTDEEIPGGDITDESGQVLGRHKGIPFYTIGQRRGLGIAHPSPLYVKEIDTANNRIVVGDKADVMRKELSISNINWVSSSPREEPFEALVKIRYLHQAQKARVMPLDDNRLKIIFDSPQLAVTPGQSAVAYDGDRVLVGGIIE